MYRRQMCDTYGWEPWEFDLTPESDLYVFAMVPYLHTTQMRARGPDGDHPPARVIPVTHYD